MLIANLITVLKNFPKKHIATLALGIFLLISLSIVGNNDLPKESDLPELKKSIEINSLKADIDLKEPLIKW